MSVHHLDAYHAWVERESPAASARVAALVFLLSVGDQPWQAPSVPVPELSDQPRDEVRAAALTAPAGASVWIWYRHVYADGAVEIIEITSD